MDPNKETIIQRIQKLLALSTSPNEAEAALALAKAQELMVKHRIEMRDVKANELRDYKTDEQGYDFRISTSYIHDILRRFFFVEVISNPYKHTYTIIGTQENVAIALYLKEHLRHKFDQCWTAYKEANGVRGIQGKASFYRGIHSGFVKKLTEEQNRLKQEYGLIVIERDPMLDEAIAAMVGKTKSSALSKRSDGDARAFHHGHEAGRNLEINHGLGQGSGYKKTLHLN